MHSTGKASDATVRIDVSSTRTGVPRPERRARLQQTARVDWASPAGATPARLEAPVPGSSSGTICTAPAPTTADSRVLGLSLGLSELSIDSVYNCLPANDAYAVQSTVASTRRAASKHEGASEA